MKTAIIIGNGTIGTAIKEHLASQHGIETFAFGTDAIQLQDLDAIRAFFENKPPFDILVNAAGSYGAIGKTGQITPEDWRQALEINLLGVYACCYHAIPRMPAGGHIITMTSGGAGPIDSISSYAAAKAGLSALMQIMAVEHRQLHINLISPGPMLSRMQQPLLDAGPERGGSAYAYVNRIRESGQGAVPVENTLRVIDQILLDTPTGQWFYARQHGPRVPEIA